MHSSTLLTLLIPLSCTALALPRPYDKLPRPVGPPQMPWYEPAIFRDPSWWPKKGEPWSNALAEAQNDPHGKNDEGVQSEQLSQIKQGAVTARDVSIKKEEELAGVYICEDVFWAGNCTHHQTPLGSAPEDCTLIDGKASSIGPDTGFSCIFYTNALCAPLASDGSDTLSLSFPGSDNLLATAKGDYNDRLLSFQCFRDVDFQISPEIGTPPDVVAPDEDTEEVVEDVEDVVEDVEEVEDVGPTYSVPKTEAEAHA